MERFVAVRQYPREVDAHLARIVLEEAGVPAFVQPEEVTSMGSVACHTLRVPEGAATHAEEVLRDHESAATEPVDEAELERQALEAADAPEAPTTDAVAASREARKAADRSIRSEREAAAVGPRCPYCGAGDVALDGGGGGVRGLLGALVGAPASSARRRLCTACGHRWEEPARA